MYVSGTTTDDLLHKVLVRLLKRRASVDATRGRNAELIGVLLRLTNPRARLSHTEQKGRIYSCIGELLWYLAKTDSLRFISYYIPDYKGDSDDGRTIYGAYGPRMFAMRGHDQIEAVLQLLRATPNSRRAVVQLFNAEDIAGKKRRKEVPCTCSWQFLVRDGRLQMVSCMRSNDAYLGLSHDLFAFTMIQEIIARALNLKLGSYTHLVGSLHLYDKHREIAQRYVNEGWQRTQGVAMPPMPRGDPWQSVHTLLKAESTIRRGGNVTADSLAIEPYWLDLVRLLQVFRYYKDNKKHLIKRIRCQMSSTVYDAFIAKRQVPNRSVPASGQYTLPFHQDSFEPGGDTDR